MKSIDINGADIKIANIDGTRYLCNNIKSIDIYCNYYTYSIEVTTVDDKKITIADSIDTFISAKNIADKLRAEFWLE